MTRTTPPCGRTIERRDIRSTFASIGRKNVVIGPMPDRSAVPIAAVLLLRQTKPATQLTALLGAHGYQTAHQWTLAWANAMQ